jgi:dihydrofolate reductase
MRKIIVLERITLDGIFDAASMSEWDHPYHSDERAEVISRGIQDSDAYLLGRTTYEMLAPGWSALKNNEYGIADKLNSMKKYVVSSSLKKAEWNNSEIISDNVFEEIGKLKQQPGQSILVHGSAQLVQGLLAADLVDELQLLVHPFVWGRGKKLFRDGAQTLKLELIEAKSLELGAVLLRYQLKKNSLE